MLQRTQVFVDTSYLLASFYNSWEIGARAQLEIDLPEVVSVLDRMIQEQLGQPVHRQLWYDGVPESGPHRYQRSLRTCDGVLLRTGQLIEWGERRTQKGVDTRLVADMVLAGIKGTCSDFVLVSGDADMIPGVQEATASGARVHLYGFGWDSMSSALRHACDSTTILDPREDFVDCMQLNILEGLIPPQVPVQVRCKNNSEDSLATEGETSELQIDPEAVAPTETTAEVPACCAAAAEQSDTDLSATTEVHIYESSETVISTVSTPGQDAAAQDTELSVETRIETTDVLIASERTPGQFTAENSISAHASGTTSALPENEPTPEIPESSESPEPTTIPEISPTEAEPTEHSSEELTHTDAHNDQGESAVESNRQEDTGVSPSPKEVESAELAAETDVQGAPETPGDSEVFEENSEATETAEDQDADTEAELEEAEALAPRPTPKPSMMAPRRKLRSRYVPLPNEVWISVGFQEPYDVGKQYAVWWYDHAATDEQRDTAHLLSGGGLPPEVDRPLLQFACETLHEYTLNETQRVRLRDGFHAGIRGVLLNQHRS